MLFSLGSLHTTLTSDDVKASSGSAASRSVPNSPKLCVQTVLSLTTGSVLQILEDNKGKGKSLFFKWDRLGSLANNLIGDFSWQVV